MSSQFNNQELKEARERRFKVLAGPREMLFDPLQAVGISLTYNQCRCGHLKLVVSKGMAAIQVSLSPAQVRQLEDLLDDRIQERYNAEDAEVSR